jgi:chloramphenicol-sensitive protein RarD
MRSTDADHRHGIVAAAGAFALWGIVPVFWKWLAHVDPVECLAHRFVWSAAFAGTFAAWARPGALRTVLRDRRALRALALSGALIATNWLTFIWAVQQRRILDTSLGYFINPLVSIALGAFLLRERMHGVRRVAVLLAVVAVAYQTIALGRLPWVSLLLAVTFGLYGYVRKTVDVGSLEGLVIETALMTPLALAYLLWRGSTGTASFLHAGLGTDLLEVATGPVTALPLLLFGFGVRRIRLSTLGFLQYIAPSLTLVLAVFVYAEAYAGSQFVTFGLIWSALALVSVDALRR